jgi:tellurium resistance protein TerD
MAIQLTKGGNINLSKTDASLVKLKLGMGWDTNKFDSQGTFDLDVSLFCLQNDTDGKPVLKSEKDFIFYNNKSNANGSIVHNGDNRTGDGEGDDETITLDLSNIDPLIQTISIIVTIDGAITKSQNFGMVEKAYIKLYNDATGVEIAKYDLTEDFSTQTALQFGSLYRAENDWKFKAVGAGFNAGLEAFVIEYKAQHLLG